MSAASSSSAASPLTVSEVTARVQSALKSALGTIWVEGEISNFTRAGSGHGYMTLKDDRAQLRAVMWRTELSSLRFQLHDGLSVLARGEIDVYAARGHYQLTIRELLPKGLGPLELAFRQLRDKLEREGLFAPARKRPLPRVVRRVALITSPKGAALRDFLEVALRRWRGADIVFVPASVQGERAVDELIHAIELTNRLGDIDVVALVRGGGSLEDLAAFNDESLARAISNSRYPIVTGVGHEIDVTIADLVADQRALTPSEAAERLFRSADEIHLHLDRLQDALAGRMVSLARRSSDRLRRIEQSGLFTDPLRLVRERTRRLDEIEEQLPRLARRQLREQSQLLARWGQTLDALSPLKAYERGYCSATRERDRTPIKRVGDVSRGERLRLRLIDGDVGCEVIEAPT